MGYIALYREWRPQLFQDIVGQEHVTRTLQNALRQSRFAHAYLFNGPRGTGKTSAAKILSKAINCERGPAEEPCNECHACLGITKGSIMDVLEIDAASNRGVDEIRDLRDKVKFAPTEVRYKVYIVDEVHMLTTEAFNALLKTLEEPPHHVMFILATTEPHKLPATIISRCQRFDFRRIMGRQIVDRLRFIADEKGVQVEEEALWLVARAAEGGMRDALSIFDQVISFGGDQVRSEDIIAMVGSISSEILADIARAVVERNPPAVLGHIGTLVDNGKDILQLMHDLITYFRDLLMMKTVPHLEEIQDRANYDRQFAEVAGMFDTQLLIQMIEQMTQVQNELKWQSQGRLLLEMLMVRLCNIQSFQPEDMLKRIQELEAKIAGGAPLGAGFGGGPQAPAAVPPDILRRLAELEQRVASGVGAPPAGNRPATATSIQQPPVSSAPEPVSHAHVAQAPAPAAPTTPEPPRPVAAASSTPPASAGLDKIVTAPNPEALAHAKQYWTKVLDEVKKQKITANAWLLAGTPVVVSNGYLVVAFKSPIHKETIMKPIFKEIIDPIFTQLFNGTPTHLYAVMESEWERFLPILAQRASEPSGGPPAPEAEPVDEGKPPAPTETDTPIPVAVGGRPAPTEKIDDLVEKAKYLFGPEHVTVLE
ncbi:DNA polymerase III subunit gamma/tau [Tumebacillus permanentifrigoris]|uniref:DNA-directed DNA polymerase n=1 Tax=Tumebacillus permanentifrigoris TaxID=378543 RepID=A0A316D2L9_9BACL|nr:DNA polymerase III subunit gamma/tau [Tumebacillus permanentifrigoris]PWK05150.1 DNA polymerase III tau subunit [Tumebacillus permanentifrigoris]